MLSPASVKNEGPVMPNSVKVALIQNCAERDMAPSIAAVEPLIRSAAKDKSDAAKTSKDITKVVGDAGR